MYLKDSDLAARFRVSRSTIWRWRKTKFFPEPIRITECCSRWREDEVDEWEAQFLN